MFEIIFYTTTYLFYTIQPKYLYILYNNSVTGKDRIGKVIHVSTRCYNLANRQGLFAYVITCKKTRLDRTTKFMVVVTSLFNLVILSSLDNMLYHAWTWLLIYHEDFMLSHQAWTMLFVRQNCSCLLRVFVFLVNNTRGFSTLSREIIPRKFAWMANFSKNGDIAVLLLVCYRNI